MDVLTTTLEVHLESKVITVPFIVFPDSTNNETLLGIDFITAAGIVIDFDKDIWYFSSVDNIKYTLSYEPTSRRVSCASTDILRDDEGTHLTSAERQALADVLNRHAHVFRAGGGPTPYAEHRIETGDHPPIAVPPYRLNPSKKQLMKAELDKMLRDDIIEERLNAITKPDTYPMPRIDELLQSTKRDCYMSTLDLRSSYWQFQYTPGKANVVADTLSRPICSSDSRDSCGICSVICDLPTKTPSELRSEQLSDPEVEKIVKELEGPDDVAAQRWLERGYLMDQGVLFRYNPDSESESPQLVISASHVPNILKELHDSPTAGHPGIDRTYQKVGQLYYFTGMRRIITDYVKACIHCQRYKATNAKPPGLLQTPVMNQRNEVLAIDLFGPLPEGDQGERWILLVEDTATRWTELYALKEATAEACAHILIEEYFMRFGLPRRIISDNGVQFVSAVMRQCMTVLDIKQNFIPLYHPESNPAERKNRDLKAMLAHLVEGDHTSWPKKLPVDLGTKPVKILMVLSIQAWCIG
ncbi:hypothetical protein B5X24_HaOG216412 [Helicoverpa armigera]|nr:hypothetical protein B5X24_HaOG216412 [Helicoverpa armigera]